MRLENIDGKNRLVFDSEELKRFPFEGKPVFDVPDTVYISGEGYAKTEAAYEAAKNRAYEMGYDDSITEPKERDKGIYFSYTKAHAAECGSCHGIISTLGVQSHGHKCELCGEPTYLKYTRDGGISLQFKRNFENVGRSPLSFRIFGYRQHEDKPDELLLFPNPIMGEYAPPRHEKRGWNVLRIEWGGVRDHEEARMILEEANDLYTVEKIHDPVEDKEIDILVVKNHVPGMVTHESVFDAHDIAGQIHNSTIIKVYNGKKYSDWDALPIPDSLNLTRRYIGREKHSLAEPNIHETIMLAAGQSVRADYYHQDGRDAFWDVELKRMTDFVEHFVDVDPEKWAEFLINVPKDGPGFIYGLADWCAKMSDGKMRPVRDEPNVWNAVAGMGKILSGEKLTYAESIAMHAGAETEEADRLAQLMMEQLAGKKVGEKAAFKRRLDRWSTMSSAGTEDVLADDMREAFQQSRDGILIRFGRKIKKWIGDIIPGQKSDDFDIK